MLTGLCIAGTHLQHLVRKLTIPHSFHFLFVKLSPVSFWHVSPFSSSEKYILCSQSEIEFRESSASSWTCNYTCDFFNSKKYDFPRIFNSSYFFLSFLIKFFSFKVLMKFLFAPSYSPPQTAMMLNNCLSLFSKLSQEKALCTGQALWHRQICKRDLPVNYQSSQIIILITYLWNWPPSGCQLLVCKITRHMRSGDENRVS